MISPEWENRGEYTVVDRPEYVAELQEYRRGDDQMMFMHLRVQKWSKETLKQALSDFKLFRKFVTCPLYACGEVDDDKWEAFVKLFGFKFLTNALCTDGKSRRIFIHSLDCNKNVFKQHSSTAVVQFEQARPLVGSNPVPDASVPGRAGRVQHREGRDGSH